MDGIYLTLATAVVVVHALWVLFVVTGAFVRLGPRLRTVHLGAVLLTLTILLTRGICPLTDLEVYLNGLTGKPGYSGGFLQHYAAALVYGELVPVAPEPFFVGLLCFAALAILRRYYRKLTF